MVYQNGKKNYHNKGNGNNNYQHIYFLKINRIN